MSDDIQDPWDAHYQYKVNQLRSAIEWLGGDSVVELLIDDWPCGPITPEALAKLLDEWAKETK